MKNYIAFYIKNIAFSSLVFIGIIFGSFNSFSVSGQSYCPSVAKNVGFNDGITNVTFNTINNTTSANAGNEYSDYTHISTTVMRGSTHSISVRVNTDGNDNYHQTVWIDWNQNGDFTDPGEVYILGSAKNVTNGLSSFSPLNITVPAGAMLGSTRMRVSSRYDIQPEPCVNGFSGEVEDYTVEVVPLVNCSGTPTAGTVTGPAEMCSGLPFDVEMNAPTTLENGITYQWQSSPSGANAWNNISGATSLTYNVSSGISAATDYRMVVTCTNGGAFAYSNLLSVGLSPLNKCYCVPSATTTSKYINNFSTTGGTQNITNNGSGSSTGGYGDFTHLLVEQEQSSIVNFSSSFVGGTAGFRIWVDWNQDGVFDPNTEVAYNSTSYSSPHSGSFTVPAYALPGTTRMRIVSHWTSTSGNVSPCETGFTQGEFEDYTFEVTQRDDCPGYGSIVGSGEACGGQNYSMTIPNTDCSNGRIYFDVTSTGNWNIKRHSDEVVVASGGSGNYTVGPFDPNTDGSIFILEATSGTAEVFQNGISIAESTGGTRIFTPGIVISPATININTPSGVVSKTVKNCSDLFVQVPLDNTDFCNTLNVNLPWEITCDNTGVTLASGTHAVTVYPQTPSSASDLVDISWDAVACEWIVTAQNDCDLLDIGTIFEISQDPSVAPNDICNDGSETFTVTYNGISGSPNCCATGGPATAMTYNVNYDNSDAIVKDFIATNNSAYINIPPNNTGGNATSLDLCIDVTNYCRTRFTGLSPADNNDYWLIVYVDGIQIYSSYKSESQTHNVCLDLSSFPAGYNQSSSIEIYIFPNTLSVGGASSTYAPNKSCSSQNQGEWKADFNVDFDVTFEGMTGSPVSCTDDIVAAYVACPGPSSPTNVSATHPAFPSDYCPGNDVALTSNGGTSGSGIVDVWYAASGQTAVDPNDCNEGFVETWNSFQAYELNADNCYRNHNATIYNVSNGILNVESTGTDPFIWMYPLPNNNTIDADLNKYINVRYKVNSFSGGTPNMRMFFTKRTGSCRTQNSDYVGSDYPFILAGQSGSNASDINPDGNWHVVSIPMMDANWNGTVTGLRLDFFDHGVSGDQMEVDFITVSKHPMVDEGIILSLAYGDEYYPTTTTTYYTKKFSTCPSDICASTTIDMQESGTDLAPNGESKECYVMQGETVHFYNDASNKYIAGVTASNNSLGKVDATVYVEPSVPTYDACGHAGNGEFAVSVLERHWVITPQTDDQATVILPYYNQELTDLIGVANSNANLNDNLSGVSELKLTKYTGLLEDDSWENNCVAGVMQGAHDLFNNVANGSLSGTSSILLEPIPVSSYVNYDIPSFSEFWLHGSQNNSPLPVELSHFSASCDKNVTLSWATESELNSDKFIVEKSRSGSTWEVVGEVQAAGSSHSHIAYELTDNNQYGGISYYRLRQVDYDGREDVYGPISVSCNESGNSILAYPNPNDGEFTVQITSSEDIKDAVVQLTDGIGKIISSQVIQISSGVTQISLGDNHYLSRGTYVFKVLNAGNYFSPIKVVVR